VKTSNLTWGKEKMKKTTLESTRVETLIAEMKLRRLHIELTTRRLRVIQKNILLWILWLACGWTCRYLKHVSRNMAILWRHLLQQKATCSSSRFMTVHKGSDRSAITARSGRRALLDKTWTPTARSHFSRLSRL
jgi:hypothetical protein